MQLLLRNITKKYADKLAVDNVSLEISAGKIFGILGPNGAGKTSLIRMITRITYPDSGEIIFDGEKMTDAHTARIGYMPEERGLYKDMKVGEQLIYLAKLKGISPADAKRKVNDWLEKLEIQAWREKKIEELSKGMAQKIQFIATVIHDPDLLILDEPFSGLDPINANILEQEIKSQKNNGKCILFSTHRMEQVEEICDDIVLINQGKKILSGTVSNLRQDFKKHLFSIQYEGELPAGFEDSFQIQEKKENEFIFQTAQPSNDLLKLFIDKGIQIKSFTEILPTLQEIFIQTVNENILPK